MTVKVRPKFSAVIQTKPYQDLMLTTLGDEKSKQRFQSSLISSVAVNSALQECDIASLLTAALQGEALGFSPSPQMGHFYMVPFNVKGVKKAQFQMGYKGYIQLAIRSGQYKRINVVAVKEGELKGFNPFTEEITVVPITDPLARENAITKGYYAFFETINGFRKETYWSEEQMEAHAIKYSMGYKAKKGYTFWEKDFDEMAFKTMLRQLISKWGVMSIEMQQAFTNDMGVIKEDGSVDYVDNDKNSDRVNTDEVVDQEVAIDPDNVIDIEI